MTRVLFAAARKFRALLSGGWMLVICIAVVALSLYSVNTVLSVNRRQTVAVAIVNLDSGEYGTRLCEAMAASQTLDIFFTNTPTDAESLLAQGRIEGYAVIPESYSAQLVSGTQVSFYYKSAAGSLSTESVIALLTARSQRIKLRYQTYLACADLFESEEECIEAVDAEYAKQSIGVPALKVIRSQSTGAQADLGVFSGVFARRLGIVALFTLFLQASAIQWFSSSDAVITARRSLSARNGRLFGFASDYLALFMLGLLTPLLAVALMPELGAYELISCIPYVLCTTSMCSLLTRGKAFEGQTNLLVPFAVLVTSVLGGCFFDLSTLSPVLRTLSFLTPQGLLLYAVANQNTLTLYVLLTLAVLLGLLSYLLIRVPQRKADRRLWQKRKG